ncbi:hypothetical protein [Bernardetia sp. MNP-M8]|uniref:hypothetical protein n=1 Tax=Bernardetia sp. MNP-M8 TaxID=3127470 RepID=UPI0030D0A5AF
MENEDEELFEHIYPNFFTANEYESFRANVLVGAAALKHQQGQGKILKYFCIYLDNKKFCNLINQS